MIPHLHIPVTGMSKLMQKKEVYQEDQEDLAIRDHLLIGAESTILALTDLTILELVSIGSLLAEYDVRSHVASDVGTEQRFLDPALLQTQTLKSGHGKTK